MLKRIGHHVVALAVLTSALLGQTKSAHPGASVGLAPVSAASSAASVEVLEVEKAMEAAVVRGDVAAVERYFAPDLMFTHGDAWITGGKPLAVDDRASFMERVRTKQYNLRELDSVKVEMHGDIAITYGHYVAQNRAGSPDQAWLSVWFERVYAKRSGHWLLVSHRTVHGPVYGRDRQSVSER